MNIFLKELASVIRKKYACGFTDITIVVPNRRSRLFLKPLLSENADAPIWSPKFMTIDEFVYNITGFKRTDNIMLSFEIYEAYCKIDGLDKMAFYKFLDMANDLLADINEIDNQMVNANSIFTYLSDCKKIDDWEIDNSNLTETQSKYIKFYESIYNIYLNLRESLLAKNTAYYGMAVRKLAEEGVESNLFNKVIFAGFNAFSKAEQIVVDSMVKNGIAELVWDAEDYFMNDKEQEAGVFLRRYMKGNAMFNSVHGIEQIEIIGTAQNIYQAKVAGDIIKDKYLNEANLSNTAIILFDENLLIPLLNSIPEELSKYNITMGYPLKNTPIYSLLESLLTIKLNSEYLYKNRDGDVISTDDVISLLSNHYFGKLIDENRVDNLVNRMKDNNMAFISRKVIEETFVGYEQLYQHLSDFVFDSSKDMKYLNSKLMTLFKYIGDSLKVSEEVDINMEFFAIFDVVLRELDKIMNVYADINIDFKTYIKMVQSSIRNGSISFYGEPLTGLQIMGILETRTLDFDNLILLSVNEGNIPKNIKPSTFIPADVKRCFDIPSIQDKTSIYAYYFYRLILKAKNIHIVYNTEQSVLGSSDKSRYILQILNELKPIIGENRVTERIETPKHISQINPIVKVEKNEKIIAKIDELVNGGLSPSALNVYLNCTLQYYYQYVIGMGKDRGEITGVLESDVIGSAIHKTLNCLYEPFIGCNLVTNELKGKIAITLDTILKQEFENGDSKHGKNFLIRKVMESYIERFIDMESEEISKGAEIMISMLEQKLEYKMKLNDRDIVLKGFIDRVDRFNDDIRIVDYKTGNVVKNEVSISEISDLESKSKAFQLLFYALLYAKENNIDEQKIESGIYSLRNLKGGFLKLNFKDKEITPDLITEFEEYIKVKVSELLDIQTPFTQTDTSENCQYCSFKSVCNR